MIANSNAKNIGATSANSTTAEPSRLRRKRRNRLLKERICDGIEATSGARGTAVLIRRNRLSKFFARWKQSDPLCKADENHVVSAPRSGPIEPSPPCLQ